MDDWVKVMTAPDSVLAEMLREFLEHNGVVSMIQPDDVVSFLGVSSMPVRVMVPIEQEQVARELVAEFEGAETVYDEFDEETEDQPEKEDE